MDITLVKAISGQPNRVSGLLVPFGSPKELDFDREYFSPETEEVDYYFKLLKGLPVLVHHNAFREFLKAMDMNVPDNLLLEVPVGRIDKLEKTDKGWYAEAILEAVESAHQWYVNLTRQMVNKGFMKWSSGSTPLPQSVRVAEDGHILKAFVAEGTLTPTPKNPYRTRVTNLKAVTSACKALNLPVPEDLAGEEPADVEETFRAIWKAMSMDEAAQAVREAFYRHEQMHSKADGRFEAYAVEVFPGYVIARQGTKYYRVDYKEDMMFAPFQQWIEVEREWLPKPSAMQPMMDDDDLHRQKALAFLELEKIKQELEIAS